MHEEEPLTDVVPDTDVVPGEGSTRNVFDLFSEQFEDEAHEEV